MRTTLICVLLALLGVASAEVFTRCEWARILKSNGMDGYHGYSLANWVCLAQWESSFNTQATHHDSDGSTDYGIFQINSRYWCDDYQTPGAENVCGINCSELLTGDVSVAISCAKRVVQDSSNGIAAWMGWQQHCQWQDLSSYVADCDL